MWDLALVVYKEQVVRSCLNFASALTELKMDVELRKKLSSWVSGVAKEVDDLFESAL